MAFMPVSGHFVYFHVGWFFKGFPVLLKSTSSGRVTGKSFSGTGIILPSSR
jgi:hypothetical protein